MRHLSSTAVVLLYVIFSCSILIVFMWMSGLPIHAPLFLSLMTGLCVVVLSAAYWLPHVALLWDNVRLPVFEEEQRLLPAIDRLKRSCSDYKNYQILVQECDFCNAYATGHRTIVISKKLMSILDEDELCGVLAHELGHLRSEDTHGGSAFLIAKLCCVLPLRLTKTSLLLIGAVLRIHKSTMALLIVPVLIVSLAFQYWLVFEVLLLCWLQQMNTALFSHLYLWLMRAHEYRQDAFAASVGYALPLRSALIKLSNQQVPSVSVMSVLGGTHPVLHNRIRKLEELAGMREVSKPKKVDA